MSYEHSQKKHFFETFKIDLLDMGALKCQHWIFPHQNVLVDLLRMMVLSLHPATAPLELAVAQRCAIDPSLMVEPFAPFFSPTSEVIRERDFATPSIHQCVSWFPLLPLVALVTLVLGFGLVVMARISVCRGSAV